MRSSGPAVHIALGFVDLGPALARGDLLGPDAARQAQQQQLKEASRVIFLTDTGPVLGRHRNAQAFVADLDLLRKVTGRDFQFGVEFSYELAMRSLRRVVVERALSAERFTDLSFNDLLRIAADAGLLADPLAWRVWRELRNATSHAYDVVKAEAVAREAAGFCADAQALLDAFESAR